MEKKYPYTGKNSFYTFLFTKEDYGECLESKNPGYLPVGYIGFCNEKVFIPIKGEDKMQNLKKGDLIIGSQAKGSNRVSFSVEPKVQANIIVANQEAERLASVSTDKKFIVCEIKGVCSVQTTVWE